MATPSQTIISAAQRIITVTDKSGRLISCRQLNAVDRLRLYKSLGPGLVENGPYYAVAYLAASVTELEAVPVPWPTNETQIEAIVSRLGDDGLEAISSALETSADQSDISTNAGNSSGTPI